MKRLLLGGMLLFAAGCDSTPYGGAPLRSDGSYCWSGDHERLSVQAASAKEAKQVCIARGGVPATHVVEENQCCVIWHRFEMYDRCDFPPVVQTPRVER